MWRCGVSRMSIYARLMNKLPDNPVKTTVSRKNLQIKVPDRRKSGPEFLRLKAKKSLCGDRKGEK